MIIIGIGKKHLLTQPLDDKCPKCDSSNSLTMEVSVDVFFIFIIPFCALAKRIFVKCSNCDFNSNLYFLGQSFKDKYKQLKPSIQTPKHFYIGSILALLLIVFFTFRIIEKDKRTEEYIYTPKVGDIYEVKTEYNWYSLLTIVNVIDDSVFVCFHKYETESRYDLKDLNRERDFDTDIELFLKDELISLYNEGVVLSVERGPPIIPYVQIDSVESRSAKPTAK